MAMQHKEETEEEIEAYIKAAPRPASVDIPSLMYTATAESEAEDHRSPISSPTLTIRHLPPEIAPTRPLPFEIAPARSPPLETVPARPLPVETAPVDFGFEPKTMRKVSVGSVESHAGSGTSTSTRKSSIGGLFGQSSGENASNTGSLAIRAMRSVRSMASLARLGGWVKGDEENKEKGKEGTVKEKKKRRVKKKVVAEDDTATSGESWEAGALSQDPTFTATIGKPISKQPLRVKDERAGLGVRRGDGDWVAGDRKGSGSSSVEPSTISFRNEPTPRVSRGSSGTSDYAPSTRRTMSSRAGSSSIEPRSNRNSGGLEGGNVYPGDNSWVGAGAKVEVATKTVKVRTEKDPARRARKGIMGLFDLPTPEEDRSQVEVRGVKIDKGRVKERVREFEARADETGPAVNFSSTRSRASVGLTSSAAARSTASLGRMMGSAVDSQRLSYIQEREYSLGTMRCVSVPLLDSPERPITQRPMSEHLLRPRSQAMADEHGMSIYAIVIVHILTYFDSPP